MAYEAVNPTLIPNTTMQKYINDDGVFKAYYITPIDGYVLHDKNRDWIEPNPENMDEEILYLGYTTGTATCWYNYDFTTNPREFYAVPEDSVPADQIFGGGNNNHEVM